VVTEREVEAGLAGVALTTRAATELVVDPAALVPLGAQDVEAAEVLDLVVLGLDGLLGLGEGVIPGRLVVACTARNSELPPSMMSVPRPAMFVATVTAPLRPASATIEASRSWCLALSTSCLTPLRRNWSERYSDFSTLTVPTRTG
jgi:hypothetical protein